MKPSEIQAENSSDSFGLIRFREAADKRGTLCVADPENGGFPFAIKRVFWIHGVPEGTARGEHAHHTCAEVVIPVSGSFTAHVTDGQRSADFVMDDSHQGLYIPPMVWCSLTDFSADCVCLCLASEPYDGTGYINAIDDFIKQAKP